MRIAYYSGASVALAGAVVLRALHERPNFYSAAVYLSQSNACLMILVNLGLLCLFGILFGLQRLFFGRLRVIEVEQLYDKAWIAVMETCLAMTMFKDHIGAWFLVMFTALLVGKVWEWLGEGRVEFLEQQPPADPRLFHVRLSASLMLSIAYDVAMLHYCVWTVIYEARPGMMVMFAFEFALLMLVSLSTSARYMLSLADSYVVKKQTRDRIASRRTELNRERETAMTEGNDARVSELERDIAVLDDEDVDVPGWEHKGRWVFYLDLVTDFIKLAVYMVFFAILLVFHGLPIHILRDLFYTIRSFVKRIHDFTKYRTATRDMNARYPDATAAELERENTCIICLQEMQPWDPATQDERYRSKKLPCGHIIHFSCLRSWLERQQVCPTCRRSVLREQPRESQPRAQNGEARPEQPNRMRVLNLGPIRIAFAAGPENNPQNMLERLRHGNRAQANPAPQTDGRIPTSTSQTPMLSTRHASTIQPLEENMRNYLDVVERLMSNQMSPYQSQQWLMNQLQRVNAEIASTQLSRGAVSPSAYIPQAGRSDPLPPGVSLPPGWSLTALQRLDGTSRSPVSAPGPSTSSAELSSRTEAQVSDPRPPISSASSREPADPTRAVLTPPTPVTQSSHGLASDAGHAVSESNSIAQPQPTSAAPTWSFPATGEASASSTEHSRGRTGRFDDASASASKPDGTDDKGKGRAVTVEDAKDAES